jgi:protein-S-isoprenylcysteine O-methyltransferase Ste14
VEHVPVEQQADGVPSRPMPPETPKSELFGLTPNKSELNRRRAQAAAGSALFLAAAPGLVAGLVPYLAFGRFVVEGLGTPAPVAPTEDLVVGGLYRYVRDPMYLAVASTILGQWLLLGRPVLLAYAVVFGATVYAFVRGYEEPTLETRYGAEYERYGATVPGWLPRLSARRAPPGPR